MSNVIDFLERMGQDARLRQASLAEVESALDGEELDPRVREAILARDQLALNELLGRGVLCCMLFPAEEEEDGEKEHEDEDLPSREDEQGTARVALSVAV